MYRKIITISIVGIVALTAAIAFAAVDYNSSRSNTSTAIVNQQVGDILLRYGIGGAKINTVTDALAVGISKVDLKDTLIEIGIGEEGVNEIFTKLDELGTASDDDVKDIFPSDNTTISTSNTADTGGDETVIRKKPGRTKYSNITLERSAFQDTSKNIIQNIRSAAPEEFENLKEELKTGRGTFKTEILSMSLSIRENAKVLRENFRENVRTAIGHVDHGKTARIAVAHGKGLRMINRFRSATARFEHILGRLESRVGKLEARGVEASSVTPLIEEAKNMQVENESKLEELKAKYEALLAGENPQGIGKEAREIAKELKAEIQTLHAKLREIVVAIKDNIAINEEGLQ